MKWYFNVIKNYVNFKGRARRKEYWMFFLVNYLINMALGIAISSAVSQVLDFEALLAQDSANVILDAIVAAYSTGVAGVIYKIASLYSLFIFLPSLAVLARRLHDTGKSFAFILINIIPVIGWIIFFVALVTEGHSGDNKYGADPKIE
ncbi:MAG: DUF805 domain-containing protein [Clostridiales bacterium]|jgi:uncharacterized membrane protein YhaH (DUF805 family)|nr:DUF805 domain-containing protein [Clostridiales bacterium]